MQTRKMSLLESLFNTFIGYFVAVISQLVVFPLVGIDSSFKQNLMIGFYFTVISIVRGYLIRRFFEKKTTLTVHSNQQGSHTFITAKNV